jgi:hypothetical protein
LGIVLWVVDGYLFLVPVGGVHTVCDHVFYDRFLFEGFEEKSVVVYLGNQSLHAFTLSAALKSDLDFQVAIVGSVGDSVSVLDFRDRGGAIEGDFNVEEPGNYTFVLTDKQGNDLTVDFLVNYKITTYCPQGGRYGSINNAIRRVQATVLAVLGTISLVYAFWSDIEKMKNKLKFFYAVA